MTIAQKIAVFAVALLVLFVESDLLFPQLSKIEYLGLPGGNLMLFVPALSVLAGCFIIRLRFDSKKPGQSQIRERRFGNLLTIVSVISLVVISYFAPLAYMQKIADWVPAPGEPLTSEKHLELEKTLGFKVCISSSTGTVQRAYFERVSGRAEKVTEALNKITQK
jgi:hypothetical protein